MPELNDTAQVQDAVTQTEITQPTPEQTQNQIGLAMAFDDISLMPKTEVLNTDTNIISENKDDNNNAVVDVSGNAITTPNTDVNYNSFVKENFGFETVEDAKTAWEELQTFKNNPPKATELTFADEESKKIHELIRQGKKKEVSQYLQAQELLSNVDSMNDEQKLKLYIKMQNPKFDKELIEDEYNSLYTIDEEDEKLLDVTKTSIDPMKLRKEKLRMEQRLENDVVKAQEYFSAYTKKIELPNIEQPTVNVDEDYEAYKASTANSIETYNNITVPSIKALKESDVQLGFKVDDANNQMQFEVSIAPTKEDFEKARQDSLSLNQFLAKTCYDKDGKFLPQRLQRMVLLEQNFDNYAQSIARQAVNEERKRVIAKEAPNGNTGKDFNVNIEKTELQKQMEYALS